MPERLSGRAPSCVIRGCVPKKLFVLGSIRDEIEDAASFGWTIGYVYSIGRL
jgi:pyruvate/2-oxoglutarate dehydrogenase complex dihydrolipoamide dehydrogenase (E3) component